MAENKNLFATPPPTINVPGRQHPVTIHFNRRTRPDYVAEAVRKATKVHNRLPPGGILIFLTGQNEITGVCRKLEARFGPKALTEKKRKHSSVSKGRRASGDSNFDSPMAVSASRGDLEAEDMDFGVRREELATDVDDAVMDEDGNDDEALDSDSEDGMEDNWDDVGSKHLRLLSYPTFFINTIYSTDAYSAIILSTPWRETNKGIRTAARRISASCGGYECRGNLTYHPEYPICGGLWEGKGGEVVIWTTEFRIDLTHFRRDATTWTMGFKPSK